MSRGRSPRAPARCRWARRWWPRGRASSPAWRAASAGRKLRPVAFDWSRITFTEHMTEAAAVVGECQVVIDFSPSERAAYEIKVYESLKGAGEERYFAVGVSRDD